MTGERHVRFWERDGEPSLPPLTRRAPLALQRKRRRAQTCFIGEPTYLSVVWALVTLKVSYGILFGGVGA